MQVRIYLTNDNAKCSKIYRETADSSGTEYMTCLRSYYTQPKSRYNCRRIPSAFSPYRNKLLLTEHIFLPASESFNCLAKMTGKVLLQQEKHLFEAEERLGERNSSEKAEVHLIS